MSYFSDLNLKIKQKKRFSKKRLEAYRGGLKKLKREIGPGVITGGADNDPAGIITYTTAGALFGYALLWVLFLCTPLMIVVQEMAARLALVKRKGLSSIIKEHYGKKTAIYVMSVLLIANIATIGADIAGVAMVIGLITGTSWMLYIIPVSALVGYLILFKKYRTIRNVLLALTGMLVVYVISSILANPNWHQVLHGFIPTYIPTVGFIAAAIGVIGTTISPYMLFWQASNELEEHKTILRPKEIEIDTGIGMIWSNIVAAFIIIAAE
jgi:NRAMP (natural resistance-associated macrophage protein)-like metal ion transporter